MSNKITKDILDKISEDISNKISKDLPVIKYINIIIRIIQNKIIMFDFN